MKYRLSIFIYELSFQTSYKQYFPNAKMQTFPPISLSKNIIVLKFAFRSIIHSEFIFLCCRIWGQGSIFGHTVIQVFQDYFFKKNYHISLNCFCKFFGKSVDHTCVNLFLYFNLSRDLSQSAGFVDSTFSPLLQLYF